MPNGKMNGNRVELYLSLLVGLAVAILVVVSIGLMAYLVSTSSSSKIEWQQRELMRYQTNLEENNNSN